jgi:hypothetical protein
MWCAKAKCCLAPADIAVCDACQPAASGHENSGSGLLRQEIHQRACEKDSQRAFAAQATELSERRSTSRCHFVSFSSSHMARFRTNFDYFNSVLLGQKCDQRTGRCM